MRVSLAVVAYPALASRDQEWIDATRAAHDPRAGIAARLGGEIQPIRAVLETAALIEVSDAGVGTVASYPMCG